MEVSCLLLLYWKENKSVWFWPAWICQKKLLTVLDTEHLMEWLLLQFKLHRRDWCNHDITELPYQRILIWNTQLPQYLPSLSPFPSGSCPEHTAGTSQPIAEVPVFFTSVKQSPSWASGISKPAEDVFVVFYLNYYYSSDWAVCY